MPCVHYPAGWGPHPRTGSYRTNAGCWYETLAEAQANAIACPSNCFIYDDGPATHPFRPIPGYGPCAHYVAHELGIHVGARYENCRGGFSVTITQITVGSGRRIINLNQARNGDIWIRSGGGHSGVVDHVDRSVNPIQIYVRTCDNAGNVNVRHRPTGTIWRSGP